MPATRAALLCLALVACLPAAAAQLDECQANPVLDSCRDFTVPTDVLERDLTQVSARGWAGKCAPSHRGGELPSPATAEHATPPCASLPLQLCEATALGGNRYSGWPSACTLWHECQAGLAAAASCQPLALLQTACNEPGSFDTAACTQ